MTHESVNVPADRYRKIWTALRTNQVARFVIRHSKKKKAAVFPLHLKNNRTEEGKKSNQINKTELVCTSTERIEKTKYKKILGRLRGQAGRETKTTNQQYWLGKGSVHIRDGREIETRASTPTCLWKREKFNKGGLYENVKH